MLGEGQMTPPDLHRVQDVDVGIVDLFPLDQAVIMRVTNERRVFRLLTNKCYLRAATTLILNSGLSLVPVTMMLLGEIVMKH